MPSASFFIRRHVAERVGNKPFSMRECLIYASRNLVDQVFRQLVLDGVIVRVARGIYLKATAPKPTVMEIIEVKVKAFNRTIATHGSQAPERLNREFANEKDLVFACDGATSSFKVRGFTVRLKRVSNRKMLLADSKTGLAIRALWHLGRRTCSVEFAAAMLSYFGKQDRRQLRLAGAVMPQWMRERISRFARLNCYERDLQPFCTV